MENNDQNIFIYQNKEGNITLDVRLQNETVWINRQQMAKLFDRDLKTIGKHINNVFDEGELDKNSVVANFATTATTHETHAVFQDLTNLHKGIRYDFGKKGIGLEFLSWGYTPSGDVCA